MPRDTQKNAIFQDNQSAMLRETNGRTSAETIFLTQDQRHFFTFNQEQSALLYI